MQIDIDHQVTLYNLLLELSFAHVPESSMQNLVDILQIAGNHELKEE